MTPSTTLALVSALCACEGIETGGNEVSIERAKLFVSDEADRCRGLGQFEREKIAREALEAIEEMEKGNPRMDTNTPAAFMGVSLDDMNTPCFVHIQGDTKLMFKGRPPWPGERVELVCTHHDEHGVRLLLKVVGEEREVRPNDRF